MVLDSFMQLWCRGTSNTLQQNIEFRPLLESLCIFHMDTVSISNILWYVQKAAKEPEDIMVEEAFAVEEDDAHEFQDQAKSTMTYSRGVPPVSGILGV